MAVILAETAHSMPPVVIRRLVMLALIQLPPAEIRHPAETLPRQAAIPMETLFPAVLDHLKKIKALIIGSMEPLRARALLLADIPMAKRKSSLLCQRGCSWCENGA